MKTENSHLRRTGALVLGALSLWFLFVLIASLQGGYQPGPAEPPRLLGLSVFVPILSFGILYWANKSLRAFARSLDLKLVIGLHIGRIIGFDFLVQYAQGRLPGAFALPAGINDVIVAVMAVPLVLAVSRNVPSARSWFVAWNLFGLVDLFLAVALGILHSESTLGILSGSGPSTLLMSQFPRSIIPTFLVPVFILLHFLALARRKEVGDGIAASHGEFVAHA
jgi:hypothetical protein